MFAQLCFFHTHSLAHFSQASPPMQAFKPANLTRCLLRCLSLEFVQSFLSTCQHLPLPMTFTLYTFSNAPGSVKMAHFTPWSLGVDPWRKSLTNAKLCHHHLYYSRGSDHPRCRWSFLTFLIGLVCKYFKMACGGVIIPDLLHCGKRIVIFL